jgi:hypothetical protein
MLCLSQPTISLLQRRILEKIRQGMGRSEKRDSSAE